MSGCDFKALADSLSERFLAEGFTVHRYDAYSTSSVYLKLDCGMCNSIRISDHRGKKHLAYRYNIGPWIKKRWHDNDGRCPRHYYPIDESGRTRGPTCCATGSAARSATARPSTRPLMRDNEIQGARATCGFWSQARKVELMIEFFEPMVPPTTATHNDMEIHRIAGKAVLGKSWGAGSGRGEVGGASCKTCPAEAV